MVNLIEQLYAQLPYALAAINIIGILSACWILVRIKSAPKGGNRNFNFYEKLNHTTKRFRSLQYGSR